LGDDYSGIVDHSQPVVAVMALATTPLFAAGPAGLIPAALWLLLLGLQVPMMLRILRGGPRLRALVFIPFGSVRAVWRGVGMAAGVVRQAIPGR
jgi:hypothetical protein